MEEKEEELISLRNEFNRYMKGLEKKLTSKFLIGESITLPDIIFYIEINTILKMDSERDLNEKECPNLSYWYKTSMMIPAIQASNHEFDKTLSTHRH